MKIEPRYYLSAGLKLLLQNRKRLLVPAILSAVAGLLISVDDWIPQNFQPVGIISNIVYALLLLGVIYLSFLTYAVVILVVKECLDSENSSLVESYKESTRYVLLIFGYTILFTILMAFAAALIMVLYSIVPYHFAKQWIMMAGFLVILMILSLLNLVMISVVIDFQSKKRLRRCIALIKNNFVPVMLILITSSIFVVIPTSLMLFQSIELSRLWVIISDILYALVQVIFVPFAAFVQIPLYRELKERINTLDSNQQPMVNEQI